MSRYAGRLPRTYADAVKLANGRKVRKLANNTELREAENGKSMYVLYHGNPIALFRDNGEVMLTNSGWGTSTTRERLNAMAPAGVRFVQQNHEQKVAVHVPGDRGNAREFLSGTVYISGDGNVTAV